MSAEEVVGSRRVFEGRIVSLRVDDVRLANGHLSTREIVEHRGAVALVAIDGAGRVLLVRQHRAAVDDALLELPAGTLEPGEDPVDCARRELEEETGCRADDLTLLAEFYTAPGFCTEYLHVYLATGLRDGLAHAEEDEQIELVREPVERAMQRVARGEIRDAKTLVGLLVYAARRASPT